MPRPYLATQIISLTFLSSEIAMFNHIPWFDIKTSQENWQCNSCFQETKAMFRYFSRERYILTRPLSITLCVAGDSSKAAKER